eukprot:m.70315 g.70315  ORF g.70315 m.70315 type:complete len:111 (-) comp7587_c0_seq1:1580-1912(-)
MSVLGWIWFFVKLPFYVITMIPAIACLLVGIVLGLVTLPMRCCQDNIIVNNKIWSMVSWPGAVHGFFYPKHPEEDDTAAAKSARAKRKAPSPGAKDADRVRLTDDEVEEV